MKIIFFLVAAASVCSSCSSVRNPNPIYSIGDRRDWSELNIIHSQLVINERGLRQFEALETSEMKYSKISSIYLTEGPAYFAGTTESRTHVSRPTAELYGEWFRLLLKVAKVKPIYFSGTYNPMTILANLDILERQRVYETIILLVKQQGVTSACFDVLRGIKQYDEFEAIAKQELSEIKETGLCRLFKGAGFEGVSWWRF
jgi:hypothetical protein